MGNTKWLWGLRPVWSWQPPFKPYRLFIKINPFLSHYRRREGCKRLTICSKQQLGQLVPIAAHLAASSVKLFPVAVRESVFWCAGHLMIATATGRCIASNSAETASLCVTGVLSVLKKPLCFQILLCAWHTPYAYAESVYTLRHFPYASLHVAFKAFISASCEEHGWAILVAWTSVKVLSLFNSTMA